jgi:hypothetical protein
LASGSLIVPLLYRTSDAAFAQAAVDALIKRGIDAYATGNSDPASASYAQASSEFRVFVRSAADSERAGKILRHLGAAPAEPARAAAPRWVIWTVVLLVLALAVALALHFDDRPR